MQKQFLKIILPLFFTTCLAQAQNSELSRADSLFTQKRYTQSFEIYKSIFDQGHYSPAMLLKMAFVQEGLSHIGPALYYLNLYYDATRDELVIPKIEELADKHRLSGYDFDATDKVFSIYTQNFNAITLGLGVVMIFLVALGFYIRKRGMRPIGTFMALILVAIVSVIHTNQLGVQHTAIISSPNTYIMDGPSAGASVIGIAEEGHKVIITNKEDVWMRVKWNGKTAYIKEGNLLPLNM